MIFRPPRLVPLLEGLAIILVLLGLATTGTVLAAASPVTLSTFFLGLWVFLLALLTGITAWRTYGCSNLGYHLTRDALAIQWASRKIIVPLDEIGEVVPAEGKPIRWVRGFHWYAYHVASGVVEGLGPVQFYATHLSPRNLVYIVTRTGAYGISLENPQRFSRYLETCRHLGPVSRQSRRVEDSPLVQLPVWRDRWALTLFLTGFAANLALFAFLSYRYPTLPSFLALHYAPGGHVDRIGEKFELFRLPAIALVMIGGNGLAAVLLHMRERYMAHVMLAMGLLVQLVFWLAVLQTLP